MFDKLDKIAPKLAPWALLFIRVTFGYQIYESGRGKFFHQGMTKVAGFFESLGIPLPELNAYLASGVELVGGALLVVGLFSRFVSVPLIFTMIVAFFTAHIGDVDNIGAFFRQAPIPFLAGFLVSLAYGPGPISLDHVLFKKKDS